MSDRGRGLVCLVRIIFFHLICLPAACVKHQIISMYGIKTGILVFNLILISLLTL